MATDAVGAPAQGSSGGASNRQRQRLRAHSPFTPTV